MKTVILYRPNSEGSTQVANFVDALKRTYPDKVVELTDVDSVDGVNLAKLYDIVQYPSILVMAEDGSLINSWSGEPLPLIDEVAGYSR